MRPLGEVKGNSIWIVGSEGKKGTEKTFEEIIGENFPTWERKQSPMSRKNREFHAGYMTRNMSRH